MERDNGYRSNFNVKATVPGRHHRTIHRSYCNPTEDAAIANIMREEWEKEQMKRREQKRMQQAKQKSMRQQQSQQTQQTRQSQQGNRDPKMAQTEYRKPVMQGKG